VSDGPDASVTVSVTLRRTGTTGLRLETDPPGLIPPDMDIETAFMRLGGEMLTLLAAAPPPAPLPPARFGRRGRDPRAGS
jgi:hypothetical protein